MLQEKKLPVWQSVFTRQGEALQMENFSFEFVTGKGFQRSSQSFKVLFSACQQVLKVRKMKLMKLC